MTILAALAIGLLGLGVALVLARVALGTLLWAAFHRVRTVVRRLVHRRKAERPDAGRRQAERRDGGS